MHAVVETDEIHEIIQGLRQPEKMISPKYFYDRHGSHLFEVITRLPEYYPTETELGIMRTNIAEIAESIGPQASLIELGSGSSRKTRTLLSCLKEPAVYVPVDISGKLLMQSARKLQNDFPGLEIIPVIADFTRPFVLPSPEINPLRNILYFPGSTIGNFTHDNAQNLLEVMHHEAGEGGALLIGVDLQKDAGIIERAYNDSKGVTAAFNLNMLRHLNRVFATNFELDAWSHDARYNSVEGRIELRLISSRDQMINLGEEVISISAGESILTEYSHKYTLDEFAALAGRAGFKVVKVWTDPERLFSVQYLERI